MKKIIHILIALMLSTGLFAQHATADSLKSTKNAQKESAKILKNNINLELFGKGVLYSIEYERAIWVKNKSQLLASVGIEPYMQNYNIISGAPVVIIPKLIVPSLAVDYTYGNKWKLFISEAFSFTIPLKSYQITLGNRPYINSNTVSHAYFWFNSIGVAHNFGRHLFMRLYGSLFYTYNKHGTYFNSEDGQYLIPEKRFSPFGGLNFGYRF